MKFPFITGNTSTNKSNALPLFIEYAWDFANDCFIMRDGKHVLVTGTEALKVWVYKTLKTERFRYAAYNGSYGVELEQFIGKTPNDEEAALEIERYITEALLVNPYIEAVNNIEFTNERDIFDMQISLKTVYGEVNYNV